MAPHLAVEILHMIATYLQADNYSLVPCILVCRSWHAAYEPLLYSQLHVSSTGSIKDKNTISIDTLNKLTSKGGMIRQSWIQHISYKISVPHLLKNYTTVRSRGSDQDNYKLDSPVRQANNISFQHGIVRLFMLLSSWPASLHVSLELSLHGEKLCEEEPGTCEAIDTREFDYEIQDGSDIVPPYLAAFVDESHISILKSACIKRLSFPRYQEHQIGAGAALQIASCCSELTELELGLDYYIRPDHLELIQARRHGRPILAAIFLQNFSLDIVSVEISLGFERVPASLRVLKYYGQIEEPWIECLPALKLIPDTGIDLFSINLRQVSYQLRELYISATAVDTDFLCPLDNHNMPTSNISAALWPNLEKLTLKQYPPVLPSGVWLMNLTPEGQAEFDAITDMAYAILTDGSAPGRCIMDHESFHRVFISLGYATRGMPRLREINFSLGWHVHLYFTFVKRSARATLRWRDGPYSPDERVARAWGFQAESIRTTGIEELNAGLLVAHTTEDIDRVCLHALRCPDSLAIKNRLKDSKDKLVHQSIHWILQDPQYTAWKDGDEVGLLWIKGGAGKGKTMLSVGLIEELARPQDESTVVIYFFCQNADYELNTLGAILKGLILQLVNQQAGLKELLRRRWDTEQESFSEDMTSWQSLWNILFEMLARCKYSRVYMVVDALDEIKWLLTSRPWDGAERVLLAGHDQVQVSLDGEHTSELVSGAVKAYINSKVEELSRQHRYGATLKREIETELTERSEGTFLWVSLVCKSLEGVARDEALSTLQSLPPGLHPFYDRVLNQLNEGEEAEVKKCMRLLKAMMTVYRPLRVEEVPSVIGLTDEEDMIRALVDCCASFIRLREDNIEFVHQSARDYLAGENGLSILDSHERFGHGEIVLACLSYFSDCLKPNLAQLPRPDATREYLRASGNESANGAISHVDYAARFWVSHLKNTSNDTDKSQIGVFLHDKVLECLECLSLLDRLPMAIDMLQALEELLKDDSLVLALVRDALRFVMRHYHTIAHWPLQIYSSATIFSPKSSIVKRGNLHKVPRWLGSIPSMEDNWTPMIQTLTGHSEVVSMLTFSPDGKQIASGSTEGLIKLWDATTGGLQNTLSFSNANTPQKDVKHMPAFLENMKHITALAFLPGSKTLISGNYQGSIMLWDTTTGDRQNISDHFGTSKGDCSRLKAPGNPEYGIYAGAFSTDGKQIAAMSWSSRYYKDIMLFDTATLQLQRILEGHSEDCFTLAFSPNISQLVSGYRDGTVAIWDTTTGGLQKTLIVSGSTHAINVWNAATGDLEVTLAGNYARNVVFSPDSKQIAAGVENSKIQIWDAAGNLQKTLYPHPVAVWSIAFSPDGKQLVTGSDETTIKRWDCTVGGSQELVGHIAVVSSVALAPNGEVIASGSVDTTIMLWNAATGELQKTIAGHLNMIQTVVFSLDSRRIASCSSEAIRIWDTATGEVQNLLEGPDAFRTVALSPDGNQLASGHCNGMIKLWDTATGNLQKTMTSYTNQFDTLVSRKKFGDTYLLRESDIQVTKLTYSPDGKLLLSASANRVIKLWDAPAGDLQKRLPCHLDSIIALASSSETGYPNWIQSVAFSSDSQLIAASCGDATIRVWNVEKSLKASKYPGRAVSSHIKPYRAWREIRRGYQV
ncbi:hypothetical protein BJX64DRAFT_294641 [Aspergillus heterothallicus]